MKRFNHNQVDAESSLMKQPIQTSKFILLLGLSILLSACGSAPSVRNSKLVDGYSKKAESIQFVYRQSELKTTTQYIHGSVIYSENGFPGFGQLLVNKAPDVFGKHGVKVTESRKIERKDTINPTDTPTLLIYATSGKISANRHATNVSFVFDANLIEAITRHVVWRASIDTSTWRGRDLVNENFKQTLYDESYAEQLLKALAEQMKQDGVI
jgi:hypothetical protein